MPTKVTTQRTGWSEKTVWVTGCPCSVRRLAGFTWSVRISTMATTPQSAPQSQAEAAPRVGPSAPAGHRRRQAVRAATPKLRSGMKTRKVVDQPGVSTMSTKPS